MTSVTSLKVFQNKIKEWKSKSLPQREQKLQSLAIEKQQALWQLKQIELEEQALHAINKNDSLAANRFAALAAIEDDNDEQWDEDQSSDGVDEDAMDAMDELASEVQEDVRRALEKERITAQAEINYRDDQGIAALEEEQITAQAEINYRDDQGIAAPPKSQPSQNKGFYQGTLNSPTSHQGFYQGIQSPTAQGFYQGTPGPTAPTNQASPPPLQYRQQPKHYQRQVQVAFSVSPNYKGRTPLPLHVLRRRNRPSFYVSNNYQGNNPKPLHELKRRTFPTYQQQRQTFYY